MNTVWELDEGAVDRVVEQAAEDYPILRTITRGELLDVYQAVRMRFQAIWYAEVYDIAEMFAVELEDREYRPSRGGRG